MLCDSCRERDAVVNLTTIENNAVHQLHLCEQCAAERGVETTVATPKHPLAEFLHQQVPAPISSDGLRCSFCNTTMADFKATGRWGCARCYTNFEAGIRELLRRVHGNHRHVGRSYRAADVRDARALGGAGRAQGSVAPRDRERAVRGRRRICAIAFG